MPTTVDQRNQIRAMTRGAYDLQSLRIQSGLRLCANYRAKLGQTGGMSEEEMDDDARKVIDVLRDSFKRLTDGIAKNRTLPKKEGFQGDEIISNYTELALVLQYLELERVERQQFNQLEAVLVDFPIYSEFLVGVRGIGPAMAAVILSEFDITRARYPSSMWAYAGLDVVSHWELTGSSWVRRKIGQNSQQPAISYEPVRPFLLELPPRADDDYSHRSDFNGPVQVGEQVHRVSYYHDHETRQQHGVLTIEQDGWALQLDYKHVTTGGRSRKKIHLVKREYVNKDGVVSERDSITYNPWLKTKLMGVVATSFLRSASPYRQHYDNYKHRIESDESRIKKPTLTKDEAAAAIEAGAPKEDVWSKGRIHQASLRYMVKMFLCDLYNAWRPLEGLPVMPTYHEGKLGHVHGVDGAAAAE